MKCAHIREAIALNRHLHKEGSLSLKIIEHINECEECRAYYNKMKLVDEAFSVLENKSEDCLSENSAIRKINIFKRFKLDKIAVAAIFVFCMAYFSSVFINGKNSSVIYSQSDIDAQYTIPVAEDFTIDLNFNSKTELTNVSFQLTLGEGLRFSTDNEELRNTFFINKKINLKEGDNNVSMAFILESEKPSFIDAVLTNNGSKFIHRIVIEPEKNRGVLKITHLKVVVEKKNA